MNTPKILGDFETEEIANLCCNCLIEVDSYLDILSTLGINLKITEVKK